MPLFVERYLLCVCQGKSFLHMYLCSVAEGGEPRMVITDRRNTPMAKRVVMSCSVM